VPNYYNWSEELVAVQLTKQVLPLGLLLFLISINRSIFGVTSGWTLGELVVGAWLYTGRVDFLSPNE